MNNRRIVQRPALPHIWGTLLAPLRSCSYEKKSVVGGSDRQEDRQGVRPTHFHLAQSGWARPSSFLISQMPKTKNGACARTRSSEKCMKSTAGLLASNK